uniref:FHA domain-containing protein n=1 Tax=Panagrellus redivivus TaxID=6233 RepID=A0A7E4V0S0_PANRE
MGPPTYVVFVVLLLVSSFVEAIVIKGTDVHVSRYTFLYIGIANVVIFIVTLIAVVSMLVYRSKRQQHKLEVAEEEECALLDKVDQSARSRPDLDNNIGPEQTPLLTKVVPSVLPKVSATESVSVSTAPCGVSRWFFVPLLHALHRAMEPQIPQCTAAIGIGGFVIGLLPNNKDSIDDRFIRRVTRDNVEDSALSSHPFLSADECVRRLEACLDTYAGRITQIVLIDLYRRAADVHERVIEVARTRAPLVKIITARQAQLAYAMNVVSGNPESALMVTFLPNLIELQAISRRNGRYIPNNYQRLQPIEYSLNRIHYQISCHRPSCIVILADDDEAIRDLVMTFMSSLPNQIQCVIKYMDYWPGQFIDGGILTALRPNLVTDICPGFYGTVLYSGAYQDAHFQPEGKPIPLKIKSGFKSVQQVNLFYDSGVAVLTNTLLKTPKSYVYHPGIQLNGDPDQIIVEVDENGVVSVPMEARVAAPVVPTPQPSSESRQMVIDLRSGQSLIYNGADKANTRWQRALSSNAKTSMNNLLEGVEYIVRVSRAIRIILISEIYEIVDRLALPSAVEDISMLPHFNATVWFGISKIVEAIDPANPPTTVALGLVRPDGKSKEMVFKRFNPNTFTLTTTVASPEEAASVHADLSIAVVCAKKKEQAPSILKVRGYQIILAPDWEEIILEGALFKLINPAVYVNLDPERPTASVRPHSRQQGSYAAIPTSSVASEIPSRFVIELHVENGCRLLAMCADGREVAVPDSEGRTWSPLCISLSSDLIKTGHAAYADLAVYPQCVIHGILPFLGLHPNEVIVPDSQFVLRLRPGTGTFIMAVQTARGNFQVVQEHFIGTHLLAKKRLAQARYGSGATINLIRVPSNFGPNQYRIIKDAIEYAELGSVRIENARVN